MGNQAITESLEGLDVGHQDTGTADTPLQLDQVIGDMGALAENAVTAISMIDTEIINGRNLLRALQPKKAGRIDIKFRLEDFGSGKDRVPGWVTWKTAGKAGRKNALLASTTNQAVGVPGGSGQRIYVAERLPVDKHPIHFLSKQAEFAAFMPELREIVRQIEELMDNRRGIKVALRNAATLISSRAAASAKRVYQVGGKFSELERIATAKQAVFVEEAATRLATHEKLLAQKAQWDSARGVHV